METRGEKKIEVITQSGKTVRVMPHMLEDMARFEVTQVRKVVKETPKELIKVPLKPVEKVDVLPKMVNTIPAEIIPPVIPTANIPDKAPNVAKPVVSSKSVKRTKK